VSGHTANAKLSTESNIADLPKINLTSVRAQLLIHRSGNESLSSLFRRHLPFHRQATAPSGVRANVATRADHVPAQNFEALKRSAYLLLDTAAKLDGYRLPLNFGWIADLVRVHFASPVVVPCAKRRTGDFVPR
jgi:hypothetical protein